MRIPKVSICIPTYNNSRFIAEAVESVLNQTYADFELIIIDDSSTDGTVDIVRRYADRDGRIRFSVNAANVGMVNNWNKCIGEAKGEYVKYLFGDDVLVSPDALRKMVNVLDSRHDVSLVGSSRYIIDETSMITRKIDFFCNDDVKEGVDVIKQCVYLQKNLIGEPSTVMFRRKSTKRGFDPSYRQIVDLEMWFRLLEKGRFAYIAQPLTAFRKHPLQQTAKNTDTLHGVDDIFRLYDEYMGRSYVTIGTIRRKYIRYDNIYEIWKLFRKGVIARDTARSLITDHMSFRLFILLIPFYKVLRTAIKITNAVARWRMRSLITQREFVKVVTGDK